MTSTTQEFISYFYKHLLITQGQGQLSDPEHIGSKRIGVAPRPAALAGIVVHFLTFLLYVSFRKDAHWNPKEYLLELT